MLAFHTQKHNRKQIVHLQAKTRRNKRQQRMEKKSEKKETKKTNVKSAREPCARRIEEIREKMNKNLRWALMVWFVRFGRFVFLSSFFHFTILPTVEFESLSVAYAQQPMYVHIAEYLDISFTPNF